MSWTKKKVYVVIYGIVNRLSMFMVISNIDFSYFIYIYLVFTKSVDSNFRAF